MSQVLEAITANLSLKIIALLTAVCVWAYAVLDRSYTRTVPVPVVVIQAETKRVLADVDTREAQVVIEAKGKDLLGVHFRQLEFRVTAGEGKSGSREVKLSADDLRLPEGVAVRSVKPEYVELRQNEALGKSVPVVVPTVGQVPTGLAISVLQPARPVRLYGSDEDLRLVNAVSSETLDMATVTEPGTRRLAVLLPQGRFTGIEPESIDVTVALEKEGARIFLGVPVTVVAGPGRSAEIDPEEAQIAVAGPASRMGQLKAADVAVQVKASGLQPGEYRLPAEISLPPGFHMVKCEPQLFDVSVK